MAAQPVAKATVLRVGVGIVVTLLLLFIYLLYVSGQSGGLSEPNAIECAVIARSLARGHGYCTQILKPLSLAKFPTVAKHPDLIYAPLHPLWEALWLKAMGLREQAVPLACGAWLFFTGLVLLLVGYVWFSPRVGVAAAIFYILNVRMLDLAAQGTEAPMLGFFFLLLVVAVGAYVGSQKRRGPLAALIGAISGLLFLTKYAWGACVLPAAIAVAIAAEPRQRRSHLLAVLGVFALTLVPWMARNFALTGNPFFSLRWYEAVMHSRTYKGNTLYRTYTKQLPSILLFAVTSPRELAARFRAGLETVFDAPFSATEPYLGAFFVAGVLIPLGLRAIEAARVVSYAGYLAACAVLLVLMPERRLVAPIAAPATLFAVAVFCQLVEQLASRWPARRARMAPAVGLVILGLIHLTPTLARMTSGPSPRTQLAMRVARVCRQIGSLTKPGDVIIADQPWPVAWYADRYTIWLPVGWGDIAKISNVIGAPQWLLLTPATVRMRNEKMEHWAQLWRLGLAETVRSGGYAVFKRLPGDWLLFRRLPGGSAQ